MNGTNVEEVIDSQNWLDPAAGLIQSVVTETYELAGDAGGCVADALHGVWLGHPLHPVLTDIPLGAWTVAAVLDAADAAGIDALGAGADAAVGIGLVGALGSAVTGLTDWNKLDERKQQRLGLAHAILNVTATACYVTSWILRRRRSRVAARIAGWLGLAVVSAGAYLGGMLVYDEKIGVDHADRTPEPEDYTAVLDDADLPEGAIKRVDVNGHPVLLVRHEGRVNAVGELCPHLGAPLSEGKLDGDCIVCPWHGSQFHVADGSVAHGPSTYPLPRFDARVRDGKIEIRHI